MDAFTILKPTKCDVRRLPINAVEAYVLSLLDGQMTVEEIAQIASLDTTSATRMAEHLVELRAAEVIERASHSVRQRRKMEKGGGVSEEDASSRGRGGRSDPRAESPTQKSFRPLVAASTSTPKPKTVRPDPIRKTLRPTAPPKRKTLGPPKPSRKSIQKLDRAAATAAAVSAKAEEKCELDEEMQATLITLDAKLVTITDHYAALGIERDADKKAIKRAYFAFVSKFHPDRFFGKKVGPLRTRIDRIFHRLTLAHDTLSNATTRTAYDATLPRARKPSRAMRASSKRMAAATSSRRSAAKMNAVATAPTPTKKKTTPAIVAVAPPSPPPPPPPPPVAPPPAAQRPEARLRALQQAAMEIKVQQRVDLCLQAAEDALRADDVNGAANNFRLALGYREDRYVRSRLEEVDQQAKSLRFTRSVVQGRAAERDQRWSDAAMHFARANETRPTAEIADRAAYAMRLSNSDLERAMTLAQQAVALEPKNAGYHLTLGEVCLVTHRLERAEEEVAVARSLGPPSDTRLKALLAAIAKAKKAK